MKTKKRRYTAEEDKIIRDRIISNPGNISQRCKELSEEMDRTKESIRYRWYKELSKESTAKSFVLFGKNKHSFNKKNTNSLQKHKVSMWKLILSLFNI